VLTPLSSHHQAFVNQVYTHPKISPGKVERAMFTNGTRFA
jgi:hypothetical protein